MSYWFDNPPIDNLSVSDHENHPTGLLDKDGLLLYRQRRPIGFGRDNEWLKPKYLLHKS